MGYSIGCDVMRESRIDWSSLTGDDPFVRSNFSSEEWSATCASSDPAHARAASFAAKEAVFKCLHLDDDRVQELEAKLSRRITFADLVVVRDRAWPAVAIAADLSQALGVKSVSLSLSNEDGLIFATALVEWV